MGWSGGEEQVKSPRNIMLTAEANSAVVAMADARGLSVSALIETLILEAWEKKLRSLKFVDFRPHFRRPA